MEDSEDNEQFELPNNIDDFLDTEKVEYPTIDGMITHFFISYHTIDASVIILSYASR